VTFYTLLLLESDGTTLEERTLDCADEEAAIECARGLGYPHRILVFDGDREVAQIEPPETHS
jgi:hypothetical protein